MPSTSTEPAPARGPAIARVREALRWYARTWKAPGAVVGDLAAAVTAGAGSVGLAIAGVEHPAAVAIVGVVTVRQAVQPALAPPRRAAVAFRGMNALAALLLSGAPERIGLADARAVWALALVVDAALSFRRAWSWAAWAALCFGGAAWLALAR